MSIGQTFPVKGNKDHDSVPWSMVEMHREEIQKAHGRPLEYLAAHGGLESSELTKIIGDKALAPPEKKP